MSELDAALVRFHTTGPEWGDGLANHGPMACEALEQLGHGSLIPGFVERYAPRLPPSAPGRAIDPSECERARGRIERFPDWLATYQRQLAEQEVGVVVERAVGELAPGVFASAGHGLLRTAHALRALDGGDPALRRAELAHGLALWAARFQLLPGSPESGTGQDPARVLERAPAVPMDARLEGPFFRAVEALDPAAFAAVVGTIGFPDDLSRAVSRACHASAAAYLEQPGARIAAVHALTLPSSVRLLVPWLSGETARRLFAHVLQAVLALRGVTWLPAPEDPAERAEATRVSGDPAEIRYRAACSLDDHAIKMAEACLREDAIDPAASLRLAAADAALHLTTSGERYC